MSKDLNSNERYLKKLADKHKPQPPQLVWDEIEQVLDKDKDKRRLFFFLWIFGFSLIGAILFINLKENENKEPSIVEHETIINDYQKQSDPNHKEIRTSDTEAINDVKQKQNAKLSETTPTVSENQKEHNAFTQNLKSYLTQNNQLNNLNTSNGERSLNPNTESTNSNVRAMLTKEDILKPSMSTQSTLEELNIIQVTALQTLKLKLIPLETRRSLLDLNMNLTSSLISKSKINTTSYSPWFLELGVGIGRNISNPISINPAQGGLRLNTESKWYSWSSSFQFGYQFDNHWYTSIGFDINQTKKRFDFLRPDVSGLIVSETENFQVTNTDFYNIGEIRYTFADVGLFIGKRINKGKWHFSLEGGTIFNFLFNANGKVQVGDLEFSRIEDQDEYFNTKINIGARLSAMLDYPISDQLWISVGPMYHQYFNTISSDENPIEERSAILQLKARVRYHF